MSLVDEQSGPVNRTALRARVHRVIGGYSPVLRWFRRYRPEWLRARTSPIGRVTLRFISERGLEVQRGIFSGMRYPRQIISHASFVPAKLLGCYESELYPSLRRVVALEPDIVVNVGCRDGLFAVGLARMLKDAQVIGYETDERERGSARQLADLTNVEIDLRGTCTVDELSRLEQSTLLVLVDVERYESVLLDPARARALKRAVIVAEIHDQDGNRWITRQLVDRFGDSHDITILDGQDRSVSEFPELASWNRQDAAIAEGEGRSRHARWMVLTPSAS